MKQGSSMMMPDLTSLFSLVGVLDFGIGFMLRALYCRLKNKMLDRWYPEDAPHRSVMKMVVVAWGIAIIGIFYTGVQTQHTHDQTLALANNVSRCWAESYTQTSAQIDLNAQNDKISRQQQALQREYDRATSFWIKSLIAPPGELADQDTNSPDRKAWDLQVTAEYQDTLNDLGAQSDALVDQRKALDDARAKHPLPEATCGK
jgi:hypothetical protein